MKIADVFKKDNSGLSPDRLEKLLSSQKKARNQLESNWKLNLSFYNGEHYTYLDDKGTLQKLLTNDHRDTPAVVRLTVNQSQAIVRSLMAKMTKADPMFQGIPETQDQSDIQSAKLGQLLFEYLWNELNLQDKRNRGILWSLIAGQGYWEIYWDSTAHKPIEIIIDPETGEPVVNPAREEALKQMVSAGAIPDLEKQTVYEGEIGVETLSPFELYLIGSSDPNDASAAIKVKGYDVNEVKKRWNYNAEPDSIQDNLGLLSKTDKEGAKKDLVSVKSIYIKPCKDVPAGKYVVWVKDKILQESDFPYKHGKLPFVKFAGIANPNGRYDLAVLDSLVPLNRALNRGVSQIQQYNNYMVKPQWWAPIGSIRTPATNAPGAINEYVPVNGLKPEPVQIPALPSYIFSWLENIMSQMQDLSGQHEVSKGQVPPNVEAGVAIGMLQEQDDTRIYPQIKAMEKAISDAGTMMLSLAKQFYQENRTVKLIGEDGVSVYRSFKNSDLYGCHDIRVVPGSTIPNSVAAQNDWLWRAISQGFVDPREGIMAMGIGGSMNKITQDWGLDKRKQQREFEKMLRGEQVEPPLDQIDDHAAHLQVLDSIIKGEEWDAYNENVKAAVLEHRQAHAEMLSAQPKPLPENVKVNYQVRDDGTASTTSSILQQAGVEGIDPETMAQETEVETMQEGEAYMMKYQSKKDAGEQQAQGNN